jgi:hypothetical protein
MQKELSHLEELVGEIDYLANEGVIVSESERARLAHLAESLCEIAKSCDMFASIAKLKRQTSKA